MTGMPNLRKEYDLVIVGSGGASMCAALVAKSLGKSVVIIEKQSVLGGSTSYSGGVWWVPNSHLLEAAGIADSFEAATTYLHNVVDYEGPAVTPQRTHNFLHGSRQMLSFLEKHGLKVRRPVDTWPDYYDDLPGGLAEGRSVLPEPFNLNELGEWKDRILLHPMMSNIPLSADQLPTVFLAKRTLAGKLKTLKLVSNILKDKILGRKTVTNGTAIQGRMLQIALREEIPMYLDTPVSDFIVENDRVTGVTAQHDGRAVSIHARDAVLVNAGGFSRSAEMRERYGRKPITNKWTNANPGDTGEILEKMIALGAATDCLDCAIWSMTSINTDGTWPKGVTLADGRDFPFMHHYDQSLPFCILVDQDGKRICNEAASYMEVGEMVYDRQKETGRAIPAWTIFDSRHRKRYPWGPALPGITPKEWFETGYMKKADTLRELASLCGIDPDGLAAEVERFNGFARTGKDEDFNRGGREFDRSHGDPTVKPNPNIGAIEQGPFYAVAIVHGDVGTSGGVVTDEFARVKRADGTIIPGLYAAGNSAASPFGRFYPGAGASISSTFTFGFIAAHHSAGSNELSRILA